MSTTTGIPSGRGRLPGMGAPPAVAAPAPAPAKPAPAKPAAIKPAEPKAAAKPKKQAAAKSTDSAGTQRTDAAAVSGPYAGEMKMQVNPRLYTSVWHHYEDIVDELPRAQRRGALTALVNAVLAQHAPRSAEEALQAINWLRQAEARPQP